MLTAKEAAPFVNRLNTQIGWKDYDAEMKRTLAEHLAGVAKTTYHAGEIVNQWVGSSRYMPTALDLHDVAAYAPTAPIPASVARTCPACKGSGRRTYWGLISYERTPSGVIARRLCEEIPIWPEIADRPWLYLMRTPPVALRVDGQNQIVETVCGWCACDFGRHLSAVQRAALTGDGE